MKGQGIIRRRFLISGISTALILIFLTACGSDNKVSQNPASSTGSNSSASSSYTTGVWSGDISTAIASYRSSIACTYGGTRSVIASYYITASTGLGVYTAGYTSPTYGDIYLGRSVFGDLMAIQKVGSGTSVSGYNVYMELCDFSSYSVPLISTSRPITNVGIDQMSLGSSSSCTYDLVLKASVWIEVGTYSSYPATSFPTSFFPIDTNLSTGRSTCNKSSYSYWNPYSSYAY